MQGFNDFYKIILFEEFDMGKHNASMLKRLLEGRRYAYPVKFGMDLVFSFSGPVIFVSNYDGIVDDALRSRFLFVSAEASYWSGEMGDVPKTKVREPWEEVETSDEENSPVSSKVSAVSPVGKDAQQ